MLEQGYPLAASSGEDEYELDPALICDLPAI